MSNVPQVIPDALRHDWRNLADLIEATAHRQVVPCFNGRDVSHAWWTSDNASERKEAARECGTCPIVNQCRQYGIDRPKEVGVYGGLTESERTKEAKR